MDIVVRRAEASDYEAIAHHLSDPLVFPGTLQAPHVSPDVWRKRLADMPETDYVLVALADGRFAGFAGLHSTGKSPRRTHAMHLGITVAGAYQGKGVGRRLMQELLDLADNWLNVFRIELTVFTDNARAIALYKQCGFEVEGTHRAYALRGGRYADTHSMARIRPKTLAV
jgi:putative acetyltransferase